MNSAVPTSRSVVRGTPYDESEDVLSLIRAASVDRPEALAVRDGDTDLTRAELASLVELCASDLISAGVRPGDVVVVEIPRSWREIVAVLGVLRAGAAYTAIDSAAPPLRAAQMLATCAPTAVIGEGTRAVELAGLADCPRLGDPRPTTDREPPAGLPALPLSPGSTAYVAFTSGSTGQPKAVEVPHTAVARLVVGAGEYVVPGPAHRYLRLAPLAFDASTFELFVPLASGASIDVFPPGPVGPTELAAFLTEREVTVAWLTAGLFRLVAEETPWAFDGLRQLLTGGDVVPADHVRAILARRNGDLTVTNGYGPTEGTTFTTTHSVRTPDDVSDPLPIGRPVRGTDVVVVDAELRPVAPGETGELLIAGRGLAVGYLGQPELTTAAFVDHPVLGERVYRTGDLVRWDSSVLCFVGRADRQVKIRGYRVELTEIESALRLDPGVSDAASTVGPVGPSTTIVAAVVAAPGTTVEMVRTRLQDRLPAYMVPAVLVLVPELPLTENGKVDLAEVMRLAMADQGRTSTAQAPVRMGPSPDGGPDIEAQVAAAWAQVLGHDDFDHDEGFFDVGGDSLSAAALHVALVEVFAGIEIRIVDLFTHPTVETFAEFIRSAGASSP